MHSSACAAAQRTSFRLNILMLGFFFFKSYASSLEADASRRLESSALTARECARSTHTKGWSKNDCSDEDDENKSRRRNTREEEEKKQLAKSAMARARSSFRTGSDCF